MTRKRIQNEISPYFDDEHYCCWDCKIELSNDTRRMVKCPHCGGSVHVYANSGNWNYALLKKYVYEIEEGDLILLRDMEYHEVLDIREDKDDDTIYRVALKGYTVVNLMEDDFVECISGTWESGTTPWKCKE